MTQQDHHNSQEEEKDENECVIFPRSVQRSAGHRTHRRCAKANKNYLLWLVMNWSPLDFSYRAAALKIILSTYLSSVTACLTIIVKIITAELSSDSHSPPHLPHLSLSGLFLRLKGSDGPVGSYYMLWRLPMRWSQVGKPHQPLTQGYSL